MKLRHLKVIAARGDPDITHLEQRFTENPSTYIYTTCHTFAFNQRELTETEGPVTCLQCLAR